MKPTVVCAVMAVALIGPALASRTLKQDVEAIPPGTALTKLAWVAAGIPSCRLDPKFFSINIDKCESLKELTEAVSRNETLPKITCEPECAAEWRKLNTQCAKDIFNTFTSSDVSFMNETLEYWGACTAQNVATSLGYPPAPESTLPQAKTDLYNALLSAPAPSAEGGLDLSDPEVLAKAKAGIQAAAEVIVAVEQARAASLEKVVAADGP